MTLLPLHDIAANDVEALLDAAFGITRRMRTAYRLRENMMAIGAFSFAVVDNEEQLLGSIQCWPVKITDNRGRDTPLTMVGPVAVSPDCQNIGIGKRLMAAMLSAADTHNSPAMMMIGDPEYYGRFGFTAEHTAGWQLPGPWEAHRLLLRNIGNQILPNSGMLAADFQYAL